MQAFNFSRKADSNAVRGQAAAAVAIAVIFGGTAGLTACHFVTPLTPQQAEGKHLYAVRCAHCHEDNDLALKKAPPDLHGILSHAKFPSGAAASDAEIIRVVLTGKGLMPAFVGRFNDEQMAELLAYLHTGLK